jgi:hypothetical protein
VAVLERMRTKPGGPPRWFVEGEVGWEEERKKRSAAWMRSTAAGGRGSEVERRLGFGRVGMMVLRLRYLGQLPVNVSIYISCVMSVVVRIRT